MSKSRLSISLFLVTLSVLAQEPNGSPVQGTAGAPKMARISAGVMAGMVDHRALPEYPEEAMRTGLQGDVIFKVDVDESGKIILAQPVEGDALLAAAGMDALRDYRFRPFQLNGTPIRVETQLGFHFSLTGTGDQINGKVECMSQIPYRPEFRTGVLGENGTFDLWPRKVAGEEPKLPVELVGKSGSVYLTLTIGADGKVQDVKVVAGDKEFIQPVVDAVKKFVYEPQVVNGKPSVATIEASYHFGPGR